jgi:lipopolysaccharide transport system ATP-binding protein
MSSSDIAVSVRGLAKAYTIAHNDEQHSTLAESLLHRMRHPLRRSQKETFWALKDVSFDIREGDVVGIIGRNGAGKSTLLKVLSRITEPTTGEIDVYGRIGSLLEVGSGFHPQLSGRENIYLNGAILGMRKAEIRREFDAIVDFAGVEKFLDTPVKRYSSGMYVRLAFAVAAHLRSEILIVDEVLAVGDAEFQKRCMGKMKDVASGGRTVLFVSHSMQAISNLCTSAILLADGRVDHDGPVEPAVQKYLAGFHRGPADARPSQDRPGSGHYRYSRVAPSRPLYAPDDDKEIRFEIRRNGGLLSQMHLKADVVDSGGSIICHLDSRLDGLTVRDHDRIEGTLRLQNLWLKPGSYRVDMYIRSNGLVDEFASACTLEVSPLLPFAHCDNGYEVSRGAVLAAARWEIDADGPGTAAREAPIRREHDDVPQPLGTSPVAVSASNER